MVAVRDTINLTELAELLDLSFATARALIDEPEFPIVECGTNGRDYKIDAVAAVDWYRHRRQKIELERRTRSERLANLKRELFPDGRV